MNDKILIFLAFVLIFVGISGYWYFMRYKPLQDEQVRLRQEVQDLEKKISNASNMEKRIAAKKKELEEAKAEYEIVEQSVITSDMMSIPDLIRVVRNYAKQAQVEFNEIKVNKLFSYEYYDELPMDFNFTGPYHNMGRMMARLENLKLINARKGRFSLSPYKKASSGSSFNRNRSFGGGFGQSEEEQNEITMDFSASSFIFKKKGGGLGVR
ncbi:MAG: type 4a pilus biogenesis protein PilO [Candidatus Muiribacteriaceae bacterium]